MSGTSPAAADFSGSPTTTTPNPVTGDESGDDDARGSKRRRLDPVHGQAASGAQEVAAAAVLQQPHLSAGMVGQAMPGVPSGGGAVSMLLADISREPSPEVEIIEPSKPGPSGERLHATITKWHVNVAARSCRAALAPILLEFSLRAVMWCRWGGCATSCGESPSSPGQQQQDWQAATEGS